ncbi:MAG: efflux RND transporter periplasmic adaptor subunit [Phycisphaerales bacterium]|nr:efflux RND transporter periplasmic adaptor subunit [Phycisphaerales bacterium]
MKSDQNIRGRSAVARIGAGVLIGVLAVSFGCKKKNEANVYAPPPPPEVVVANPVEREVIAYLNYTGTIEAAESVDVRARVQGFLEKQHFQAGQRVKKGDLLFAIDKRQYEAAVEKAQAAVRAQEAALEGAENDARLARELADQRAGPEIDAVIKAAKRDVAKADLSQAKAALTDATLNLDYCTVTAPIDGRITSAKVDVGNLVGRGEPTLLATIVQAVPAYVSVDVSESDVLGVRAMEAKAGKPERPEPEQAKQRTCELGLSNEAAYRFQGRVDYVAPELNAQTGTLRVRTRFENADELLLPGLFARLRFPMSTRRSLVVPEAALLSDQQGRLAMVLNEKDEVEARRVKIGVLDGSDRVVEEGLTASDRVIVLGVLKARPGSKVTPKMQQAPAAGR